MNAFDADVLIFAAAPEHPHADWVRTLLTSDEESVGSVMLLPELLIKPLRTAKLNEQSLLLELLGRIDLLPVDEQIARTAVVLGAKYGLRSTDSVHLATAVVVGADRFVTNNHRDFSTSISEIDVVYPNGAGGGDTVNL